MEFCPAKKYSVKLKNQDILPGWYMDERGRLFSRTDQLVPIVSNRFNTFYDLYVDGKRMMIRRDLLVVCSILGYHEDIIYIDHINGDVFDCRPSNLRVARRIDIQQKYLDAYNVKSIEEIPEEWKVYPKDQRFEVSNFGGVRLADTKEHMNFVDNHGYVCFHYHQARFNVHRMVAECFVDNPNPSEFTFVNHIDGVKNNNKCYNLEWCNLRMNRQHAILSGLDNSYTEDQIRNVCKLLVEGKKHTDIAILTGVSRKLISDIQRGRRHKRIAAEYGVKRRIRRDELYNRDGMLELMRAGYKAKEIAQFLEIEYNQAYVSYYEKLRRVDLKEEPKKV